MAKLPVSRADEKARIERLARWLDARFVIPGTGIRFGLDSLIGLVPGVGDLAMFAPAVWIIARAVAPSLRSFSHWLETEEEPPVTWTKYCG